MASFGIHARFAAPALLALLLVGACGGAESRTAPSSAASGRATTTVTLPDGEQITAELALTPEQHALGLMFREKLPPDRGMLFVFPDSQPRGFWMYQTRIPLDILWMDEQKRIVEIAAGTPPCHSAEAADCPSYGGRAHARYVLELAAGQAAARGLHIGDTLRF